MNIIKKKKAQQIVEFLLVAPFIIGFLALFTEYAYALNINLTLTKSLKESTVKLYRYARPNMNDTDIVEFVKSNLAESLKENNIPLKSENNLYVNHFSVGDTSIFMATYTYYPAFTLPAVFFNIMPEKFNFMTTASVPSALLNENNYSDAVDSLALDKIWSASNFSDVNAFDGAKNGILKSDTDNNGRKKIIFLVPTTIFSSVITDTYMLVKWGGEFVSDPSNISNSLVFTKNSTMLYSCSVSDATCTVTSTRAFNYLNSNKYYYVYVVHDDTTPTDNISNLSNYWNYNNDENLSLETAQGILKKTISMTDTNNESIGNYDNISVDSTEGETFSNTIKIFPFGSMIFIDESSAIANVITQGQAKPSFTNFGG